MTFKQFISITPLVLFLVSGCVSSPAVVVKAGSGEQTITAKTGSTFAVKLESQMSTGYSWKLNDVPSSVKIIKESVLTETKDIAGGIDIQEFVFKAVEKGDLTLTFRYGEHWKEKPRYVKTSTINVKIE